MSYHILITNNETGKIELDKNNQIDIICLYGEKVGEHSLGVGGYYRTWNNAHRKFMMQVLVSEPEFLTAIQEAFDKPEKVEASSSMVE